MKYFLLFSLVTLFSKSVTPQLLRPPFNYRPIGENILDTGTFINQPAPTVISEPPCNSIVPIPSAAPTPSTTIITDCSPTVCQNLANTIQLMIVCNLLQNSKSSDLALQLATPLLNEVMTSPVLSCGCNNPLSPTVNLPSIVSPSIGAPNVISSNYIPPNLSVTPQLLRPPFNYRPIGENILDTGTFINQPAPTVISEPPCNSIVPIPSAAPTPSTTIITDCSPTVCQNLANTIQLMIVCNLLQNSKSSDLALQLATPLLNEVMTSPVLSCGCNNPLSPTVNLPSIVSPSIGAPNVISSNYIPPNLVSPNIYLPNPGNSLLVPTTPNIVAPSNVVSLPPRVVAPAPCPNSPQINPANVNGLLNTIMGMLGNIQG
uniref:Uncharacterized protein n=1 Tax=Heliothis virescens TaxID=7102 RepID=A0A2A4JZZ3_HELVI